MNYEPLAIVDGLPIPPGNPRFQCINGHWVWVLIVDDEVVVEAKISILDPVLDTPLRAVIAADAIETWRKIARAQEPYLLDPNAAREQAIRSITLGYAKACRAWGKDSKGD